MRLIIENCPDRYFILYLINFLKTYIINVTDNRKLYKLDLYLNSIFTSKYFKILYCRNIIKLGALNLVYHKYNDYYEITIDENKKCYDLNAKLCDICKLINYGSMSVQGYPIFTEAFDYVENNIEILWFKYTRGF